ncbi:hypothetical protein ACT453_05935, partial [Bacillus sp. D-CC]
SLLLKFQYYMHRISEGSLHLTSSSFDFALDLVKEAGLAVVPGTAFSEYGEGYLRLSYAYSIETLKEGCDRLEAFLQQKS